MSATKGSLASLVFVPLPLLMHEAYVQIHGNPLPLIDWPPVIVTLIVLILVHELIHLAFFRMFRSSPLGAIKLGFSWQAMMPYATCSSPLMVGQYRICAMAPLVLLGLIPYAVAFAFALPGLEIVSIAMILAAAGDMLVLALSLGISRDRLVVDHPEEVDFLIHETGKPA